MKEFKMAFRASKPKVIIAIILAVLLFWIPVGLPLALLINIPFANLFNSLNNLHMQASTDFVPIWFSVSIMVFNLLFSNFIAWYCLSSIAVYVNKRMKSAKP